MKKYILAFDQGTSSSRALIFDKDFKMLGIEQEEYPKYYPNNGWVEQNPEEIWESQIGVAKRLIEKLKINPEEIGAIGITNQRETTIIWDKKTGKPVYNAIVWQDKRTAALCNSLKETQWKEYIHKNTGLQIDPYFSATKIKWILDNIPGLRKRAENGEILFGTVDTWLMWKLSGGAIHKTDYSNASRTMIYNIKDLKWDEKLLELFEIPPAILPEVTNSMGVFGYTEKDIFGVKIPVAGVAGDQQAALFGQMCFDPGMAKNTYGTGCFILMNTGKKIKYSDNGILTTIAWGINNKVSYALEGSIFIAGSVVKWLRDSLNIIKTSDETEQIALSLKDNGGVYFVPAFVGLGAPYWDMYARGAIVGLTEAADKRHIVRAALESMAYQTKDVFDAMYQASGITLEKLFVDGGAAKNNFLMQFQADILNVEIVRPKNTETTALGAAFLAALGTNFVSFDEIQTFKHNDKVFKPAIDDETRQKLYNGWKKAIEMVRVK